MKKVNDKYGKKEIGSSKEYSFPKPKRGYSIWIENGIWYTAPTVNKKKFGPHRYGNGIGECECGCAMWDSDSYGPVDPFGACPLNPQKL